MNIEKRKLLLSRERPGEKILLGVVHLRPLPGSPGYEDPPGMESVIEAARDDARRLLEAGFDGYVIENFGDLPFFADKVPPITTAAMTRIACELPTSEAIVIVNVLRNDPLAALSIAAGTDLQGIRVNVHTSAMLTDQGIIEGQAAETLRLKSQLGGDIAILADVDVKHAVQLGAPRKLAELARETAYRGLADALVVTGRATGSPVDPVELTEVRNAVSDRHIFIGSGANESNIAGLLELADGAIVGSALKIDGDISGAIDPGKARSWVLAARG
jgi:membrane complex biogenesis BtpA family protein